MSDIEKSEEINQNEKGSFLKGFIISFCIMIILLILLGFTIVSNPEALGRISLYPVIGSLIAGFISRKKKRSFSKMLLISISITLITIIFGFFRIS